MMRRKNRQRKNGMYYTSLSAIVAVGSLIICALGNLPAQELVKTLRTAELKTKIKAARDFANEVTTDPKNTVEFNQTFVHALDVSRSITKGTPVEPVLQQQIDNISGYWEIAPDSIYRDERYQTNFRALVINSSNRILQGTKAPPDKLGFCVAVGDDEGYFCTGSLVASRLVVTAGHCIENNPTKIFVGSSISGPGTTYRVVQRVIHPKYDPGSKTDDLSLLVLERPVVDVSPTKIASPDQINAMGSVCLAGFGNTDVGGRFGFGTKMYVDVPVVSSDGSGPYGAHVGSEFVAVDKHGKDSCRGDSGGPALIRLPGDGIAVPQKVVLAGATSRATKMASAPCGDGGIYVRLDKYTPWIDEVAKQNQVSFP